MTRAEPRPKATGLPGAAFGGVAAAKPAAGSKGPRPAGGRDPAVSDELATALAALAAEYAPLPVSTAPFISVKEREVAHRQRRRTLRLKLAKIGAAVVLGMGVLYLAVATLLFRAPTAEALEAGACADNCATLRPSRETRAARRSMRREGLTRR